MGPPRVSCYIVLHIINDICHEMCHEHACACAARARAARGRDVGRAAPRCGTRRAPCGVHARAAVRVQAGADAARGRGPCGPPKNDD